MNYTEKYHLPQWVETDRIMMNDFNAAMASIEGGLAAADRAGALADSMSRDVYRQIVQSRVCHGPGDQPRSMWINALTSREDAGGEGHGWNGRYGVCHGTGGMPTMEGIRALGPVEEQYVNVVAAGANYNSKAIVTFTSDGSGMLDAVMLWFSRQTAYGEGGSVVFTISVSRRDTGETLYRSSVITIPVANLISVNTAWHELATPVPLEAQVKYELRMQILSENTYHGTAGFTLQAKLFTISNNALRFSARELETEITKTVTAPEWAASAVGILRWKGDGDITPTIDGQAVLLNSTQEELNALGETCKASEFPLPELPREPFELSLLLEQGEEDLCLYDYGLIWR